MCTFVFCYWVAMPIRLRPECSGYEIHEASLLMPVKISSFVAISAVFTSAQISVCKEKVITQCPCGLERNLTDVYVDGCQVASNESHSCQPCPGSCQLFLNCQKCSKHDCLSCPLGQTGPTCEYDEQLHSINDSVADNNQTTEVQNATEISSSTNTTAAKVAEYGFDEPLPKMVVFDISKIKNSSSRPVIEGNQPEIKLDIIEFNSGKTSIVEVIPDNTSRVLESKSMDSNGNVLDVPQICTSNCSEGNEETENRNSVVMSEINKDVLSHNETKFGNKIDLGYPQKNETMSAPFEGREISGEYLPFGETFPVELAPVNDVVNTFNDLQKDYSKDSENGLTMHRSPNPSVEEDNTMIVRHVLKKNLQNEPGQLDLDDVQQDYSENMVVSRDQEVIDEMRNSNGLNDNDSQPESNNKTTPETKYLSVYDLQHDENESKYPDIEYQSSFPVQQELIASENLNAVKEIGTMQPDPQYDFSKPHQLKQYFESKEEENPKLEKKNADLWKNLCKVFPNTSVCRQTPVDDTRSSHDPHSHVEHTFRYFRSPDYPGSKLLFPNTESNSPNADLVKDPSMDTIQEENDKYYKSHIPQNELANFGKEQSKASLDAIQQQQNDQYIESLGSAQIPGNVPRNIGIYDQIPSKEQYEATLDTIQQQNDEYFESLGDTHKSIPNNLGIYGQTPNREQYKSNLDTIQQQNDQYFESLGNTHKPIPKNFGFHDQHSNPSQSYYFGQGYAINPVPPVLSQTRDIISEPPKLNNLASNFQKSLVPTLFDHLMRLIGPHITPFLEDRSYSGENRVHSAQNIRLGPQVAMSMQPSLKLFPLSPAIVHSLVEDFEHNGLQKFNSDNSFKSLNFRSANPRNFFSAEHQKTPVVQGQIFIANIAHENGTAPRVVPGSVRTQNFEFEIPMLIPSLYPDGKESKNLEMERPKHGKGSRRTKKLRKRRRNGVKNDSLNNPRKCDPWTEDCKTIHGKNINIHSRKAKPFVNSKITKKDGSIPGHVHIKFIKLENEPMYDSAEIPATSMPNPSNNNDIYSQTDESIKRQQDVNLENENCTTENEIAQAPAEPNSDSDSESNRLHSRSRRSTNHFCPIPKESRNGDLDCTIWSYKKACTLTCHSGYTSPSQYFTCQRSKNNWVPPLVSCTGGPGFELADSSIQHTDDIPQNLDDDEEEESSSRDLDIYKEESSGEDYVKDSGEKSVQDQEEDEETSITTARPIMTHVHKKKAHMNSVKVHEESHEEVVHAHKGKVHVKGHESHAKVDKPKHHQLVKKPPLVEEEEESKEESQDEIEEDVPKTRSDEQQKDTAERQSGEESSKDEVDETQEEQGIVENEQNKVDAEYDESKRRK